MKRQLILALLIISSAVVPAGAREKPVSTPLLEALSHTIKLEPDNAMALSERGFAYAMVGEKQAARADFEKALAKAPGDLHIRWSYGWALFNLGLPEKAVSEWKKVIKLRKEETWWAPHTLALGYWACGDKTRSLQQYDKAAKDYPGKFGTWEALCKYTAPWTWEEKRQIYQVYDAWSRAYKADGQ